MASKRDYYDILSVGRSASQAEIKRAYRDLAKKYHPDLNHDDATAEEKFKEAAEAYSVLSDESKRATYDQFGHEGLRGGGMGGGFSFEDIFSQFGDVFGMGDLFGRGRRRGPAAGKRVAVELTIEFDEAMHGTEKTIEVPVELLCERCDGKQAEKGAEAITCPTCRGRGQVQHSQGIWNVSTPCPRCGGQGKVIDKPCKKCDGKGLEHDVNEVTLTIPSGVDTGTQLRLRGQGDESPAGGPRGDLYVALNVLPSDVFERRGPHLITEVHLSFVQAALGCVLDIPTIHGPKEHVVKPGTQPGAQVVFQGDGVPGRRGYDSGDLVAVLTVEIPTELDKKQRELLQEYAEISDIAVKKGKQGLFRRRASKGK